MNWSHHQQDLTSVFYPRLDQDCALMCSISACLPSPNPREIVLPVLLPWSYTHPYLLPPSALMPMEGDCQLPALFYLLKIL